MTEPPRPFVDLRDTGILWAVNRALFHPRGYALALHCDADGSIPGGVRDDRRPEGGTVSDGITYELREPDPPEPCTWERIAAFDAELEACKRILACAPDVYQRVKTAVEASTVAGLFEVVEHPWLDDGQVFSIDPAALKPPPFELPADWRPSTAA